MAQLNITSANASYSENFNSYQANGSNIGITGWSLSGAANYRGRATGTSNTGGFYAFGSGSDYSLGALRSSSNNYTYSANFTNGTGLTITGLTLGWNYEQWRYANTSGWDVTGSGALAGNATLNTKDFTGSASGTSGTVTTTAVTPFALSSLSISNSGSFGMSWVTTDQSSSDNGVSIDDFTMQITSMALGSASTSVTSLAYGSGVTISGFTSAGTLTANIGSTEAFAGRLQNNGANALSVTKTGNGTLTFSGTAANTYTGTTTVNSGTLVLAKTAGIDAVGGNVVVGDNSGTDVLQLDASNQIADAATVTVNGTGANTGIFRLNGNSEAVGTLNGTGIVENNHASTGSTLRVSSGSFSGSLRNGSTGALALVKEGEDTLTLSGSNSHSGGTSILDGTLNANSASALGTGATLIDGGSLVSSGNLSNLGDLTLADGFLNPGGSSAASLSLGTGSDFVMTGGVFTIDLDLTFDFVAGTFSSSFTISGGEFALNLGDGFDYGFTYQLFSGFGSGSVSDLLITGYDDAVYTANLSDAGVLSFSTAVPEPHEYALATGLLLLTVIAFRRRKRATA